jgi:hypothetical protein
MALLHVTQLYAGLVTHLGSPLALYTVPAGYRVVLRDVELTNHASVAQGCDIAAPMPVLARTQSLGSSSSSSASFTWSPWIVLGPGDQIGADVGNSGGVYMVFSGSIYFI